MPRRTRSKGAKRSVEAAPARSAENVDLRAQALAPDLEAIRRFIVDMLARGAIVELVSSVLALLQRMREINTELMSRIAAKSRKRPPSETLRRLQMELPLMFARARERHRRDRARRPAGATGDRAATESFYVDGREVEEESE